MTAVARLVVSAPSSGHGKTAVAVGLLAAFAARGLAGAGFKIGPDHTDAAYLGLAAGRSGRNLDPRLAGAHRVGPLFAHGAAGADIAVVEGTMGLFDSLTEQAETDSTAGVAAALRAPVVLVVDVAAMGQSVAALVHGFRAYDELLWLGGVILNRVASRRHQELLQTALDDIGVPVLGWIPRGGLAGPGPTALPPRGQGVVPVLHRSVDAGRAVRRLGEAVAEAVDLDGVLALARSAPGLTVEPWSAAGAVDQLASSGRRPMIVVAGDETLSYGYVETAELLAAAGAEVISVDPLRDEILPEGTDALVVCGGLPESYAEELSANVRLGESVAELAAAGRPILAEGAGLAWLAHEFDGRPMCGVLDAAGRTAGRPVLGYREATAAVSSLVAPAGTRFVGYKEHRGVLDPRAGGRGAWTWGPGSAEGFVRGQVYGSYLRLHWAGAPEIATRVVSAATRTAGGPARPSAGLLPGLPTAPSAGLPVELAVGFEARLAELPVGPQAGPVGGSPGGPQEGPVGGSPGGPQAGPVGGSPAGPQTGPVGGSPDGSPVSGPTIETPLVPVPGLR